MPKNFTFEPTEEFMQAARKACAMSFRVGENDTETNYKKERAAWSKLFRIVVGRKPTAEELDTIVSL